MAPNVVSRSSVLQDSFNSVSGTASRPTSLRTKSLVRTEFVVTRTFYHLIADYGYQEQEIEISAINPSEAEVVETLKKVVNDFRMSYSDRIVDLCSHLEVTPENINSLFLGVVNELFSEGITWGRISALFVFSSELAVQCLQRELPETVVDVIMHCCLEFVQDKLKNWVEDHGGWEGIVTFSRGHENSGSQQENSASSPSWARSVLHGTVRIFGTLAHIANSTGQIMALPMHNVGI